jgi:nitrogen fixation protein
LEMAQLLPVMPRELNDWLDTPIPLEDMDEPVRVVSGNDTWRSGGAAFTLIQRNELLRAMSW